MDNVRREPNGTNALSGTPGIRKRFIVIYLFARMPDTPSLAGRDILYQRSDRFYLFSPKVDVFLVNDLPSVMNLVTISSTFYIIDGHMAEPVDSKCLTLFMSSPRNHMFQDWCKEQTTYPLYLPVWTLEELETCHPECYPDLSSENLESRYLRYGGVPRTVFWTHGELPSIDGTINDANARKSINSVGTPSRIFPTSHLLLHIIVNDDLGFQGLDIASDYIGVLLFENYYEETMEKLNSLIGDPGALGGHLFECYMHYRFKHSDNLKFRRRSLEGKKFWFVVRYCLNIV